MSHGPGIEGGRGVYDSALASKKMSNATAAAFMSGVASDPKIKDKDPSTFIHATQNQSPGAAAQPIKQLSHGDVTDEDFANLNPEEMRRMREKSAGETGGVSAFDSRVDSMMTSDLGAKMSKDKTREALGFAQNNDGTWTRPSAPMGGTPQTTPQGGGSPPAQPTPLEGGGKIRRDQSAPSATPTQSQPTQPTADFGGSKIHRNSSGEVQTESGIILPGQAASDALNRKKPE